MAYEMKSKWYRFWHPQPIPKNNTTNWTSGYTPQKDCKYKSRYNEHDMHVLKCGWIVCRKCGWRNPSDY